jgi:hypothetical protein
MAAIPSKLLAMTAVTSDPTPKSPDYRLTAKESHGVRTGALAAAEGPASRLQTTFKAAAKIPLRGNRLSFPTRFPDVAIKNASMSVSRPTPAARFHHPGRGSCERAG